MLDAVTILQQGGVVACPTEAVWGISCAADNPQAIHKVLELKQRPVKKGMIVAASTIEMLDGWVDWSQVPEDAKQRVMQTWPGPYTWVLPATEAVLPGVTGANLGKVAVRVTAHPVLKALIDAFGKPILSTSANLSGEPPVKSQQALSPALLDNVDIVVPGEVGGLENPTAIRDALTGHVIRT